MSQGISQNQATYKPGTIKSIKLINFMCHDSFELTLGPRVNFVIGPNGSGKSALLTALVVVLGGRASITSRARKTSDFVMYGKRYAKISVTIHNYDKVMEKDFAFKPDDYGKWITVEKIIYKDDISKLALRNDKDKKISERKQELDEMLDHFSILINNPICILNQEVSKTFLHSKRPEDKFELFMKATSLEQIEQDYNEARLSFKQWEDCNNRSTVAFKLLEAEYNSCKEKTSFLERRARLNDDRANLVVEMYWALLRDDEKACDQIRNQIESTKDCIKDTEKEVINNETKIRNCNEDIELFRSKSESIQKLLETTRKKVGLMGSKGSELRMKQVTTKQNIDQCSKRISRLDKDKRDTEKAIEDLRKQLKEQNADHDSEKRKAEMEQLEKDIELNKAKERSIQLHVQQLSSSMTRIRGELHAANTRTSDLRNKLSQYHADLRRLKNSQENELRKYGDFVIKVIEEIDKLHGQGRFKRKPLGPLGYYLKLENPEIAGPLEVHLGRNAHAFLCDNYQDMAVLSGIFKRLATISRDFRQPTIVTRPFVKRHDVTRYRAQHQTHRTLLDYLDIENDAVFNALVDRTTIECILYIPDYNEAQELLITPNLVPPNTRSAYTKDSSVMYPITSAGGYRTYSHDTSRCSLFSKSNAAIIKQREREIDTVNADIREAETVSSRIQDSLNAQRKEYDEGNLEIRRIIDDTRKKEDRLTNLKLTVVHEPQELQYFEEERANFLKLIAEETVKLEQYKDELLMIETDLEDYKKEKDECSEIMRVREEERQTLNKKIGEYKETVNVAKDLVKHRLKLIENRKRELDELTKKLDHSLEELAKRRREAPPSTTQPGRIRETEKLREEVRKIDAQIRAHQEDLMDPDEMLMNLRKRMKEIEDMTYLKNLNLNNAKTTCKTLDERAVGFENLRKSIISSVASTFSSVMRSMKMNGVLEIHLDDFVHRGEVIKKAKTLEMTDARSLSGGERSFSTVAFVLALWQHCGSPFKLMDEIDVFMDMVTRRVSYNALIRFAQCAESPGQFIFFSPLELPKFDDSGAHVQVFEMPAIVRKGNGTNGSQPVASLGGDEL